MRRVPWLTLALAGLACLVQASPALTAACEFVRPTPGRGEFWRLFTAHLAHYGVDHLTWDVAALLILGPMAEAEGRRVFASVLVGAALLIGVGVWAWQPQLTSYRGLSGLDSAVYGLVCARLVGTGWKERHGFSLALGALALAGFALKCGAELATNTTVFAASASEGYVPVPLAHLLGMAAGMAGAAWPKGWRALIPSPQESVRSRA